MSESWSYEKHPTRWHLFWTAALLIGGCVALFRLAGIRESLASGQGEITLSAHELAGPILLLLIPIPLVLEWVKRRTGWLLREKKHVFMLIIPVFVLMAVAHSIVQDAYPPYFRARGWEICGGYDVNTRHSNHHYDIWRPVGTCKAR